MADFRDVLESLGCRDVRTLLNSGNAVFRAPGSDPAVLADEICAALEAAIGASVPVVAKSDHEFARIVEGNLLAGDCEDASRLLVAFAQDALALQGLSSLAALAQPPERFHIGAHAAYLSCPQGILASKVATALLGRAGRSVTTRNWATVQKLDALLAGQRTAPATVDEYISAFPPDVQAILQQVRQAVRRAAPDASETISYQIPAVKLNGVLVYYAAFRKHIGFYPPVRGDARLEKAAAPYAGEKGNLRFPYDQPIPFGLIERVTKLRVKLDRAGNATRGITASGRRGRPGATTGRPRGRATPDE